MKTLTDKALINKTIGFVILLLLFTWSAWSSGAAIPAALPKDAGINWFQLGMGLFGGLALFLAGLDMLSEGLKKAAGETLKLLLSKLTTNRFMGTITGAFVTGVLNSSSVTTVLVVSFITAGTMTLSQSVGVIMGANIGSTVTAQLLAFNLSAYALLPIAIGFFMSFTAKQEKVEYYGMMLMGIGLVFFGMGIMSDAMIPLRSYEPFIEFLKSMESPVIGLLAGAIFTGLVQSSAATVGIAIAMASEGLLSLPAGIALALGANIGTCVTVMLAAIGKPVEAKRAAIVHVMFNVMGALIWIMFIPQLAEIAVMISPGAAEISHSEQASLIPRQIANANTLFNIINTILFIGFTGWFAQLAIRLAPAPPEKTDILIEAKYLYEDSIESPTLALEETRMELNRMGGIIYEMLLDLRPAIENHDRDLLKSIVLMSDKVNMLESLIFQFLSKIRKEDLTEKESHDHQTLMTAAINLRNLSDVIKGDMVEVISFFIANNHRASDITQELFQEFYQDVCWTVDNAVKAIGKNDQQAAEFVVNKKTDMKRYVNKILSRKSSHLGSQVKSYIKMAHMEISLMQNMYQLYFFSNRVAEVVIPEEITKNNE